MRVVYWIYKNGHQKGPFTFSKIQNMWQASTINVTDQIRRMDQEEWRAIGKISRQLELGRNELPFQTATVIMLVLLSFALVWLLALVW